MAGGLQPPRAARRTSVLVIAAFALAVALLALRAPAPVAAEEAAVVTDGGCLRLRAQPSLDATILACLAEGTMVDAADQWSEADGHTWRMVTAGGQAGWVASTFLSSQARPDQPATLHVPPVGGLTFGRSGTASVEAFVAAQPFEVSAVFVLDVDSQQFRMFNPALRVGSGRTFAFSPDDIVLVRRSVSDRTDQEPGSPIAQADGGSPSLLPIPPRGGLTVGLAGTDDIVALIAHQRFTVDLVTAWDVEAQQWTMYRPDAPAFANSLTTLGPSVPVFLRRDADAPDPEPPQPIDPPAPPTPSEVSTEPHEERITYYYCERGENPAWWGDGGGWCGAMANGELAHEGAASCARHLMGQQFVIVGDPTERVYTCKDTGGGVADGHRDIWFRDSDTARVWWDEVGSVAVVIPLEG